MSLGLASVHSLTFSTTFHHCTSYVTIKQCSIVHLCRAHLACFFNLQIFSNLPISYSSFKMISSIAPFALKWEVPPRAVYIRGLREAEVQRSSYFVLL